MRARRALLQVGIVAVAAAIGWRAIVVNALGYDDNGRPRPSLPTGGPAAAAEREALLEVVSRQPAEVGAVLMLARERERSGDPRAAAALYRAALAIAPMERAAVALAADFFLRRDDPEMLPLIARLAAHYGDGSVHEALAGLLGSRHAPAVAALLAREPGWAGAFIASACARGADPDLLAPALLARLAAGEPAPEAACVIGRLRELGRVERAYHVWLHTLPRARLASVGHLYNGDFETDPGGTGFDWELQRDDGRTGHTAELAYATGALGERALRVTYLGKRQAGYPAQQHLALAPGAYELTGLARVEGIRVGRGVHWAMRCLADNAQPEGAPLATSERFVGSEQWRRFTMRLEVPPGCPGQLLRLEPAAEPGATVFVAGAVFFDELRIVRAPG